MTRHTMKKVSRSDLVVIGAGGSGLAAAVAASESGVKQMVMLESANKPGGNSVFPTGIMGADTKLQKRLGAQADKDVVFRTAMAYAHWKLNGKLVRKLINRSSATIDWLESKGVVFDTVISLFNNFNTNTYHSNKRSRRIGALTVQKLQEYCHHAGIPIFTKSRARKILVDNKGAVNGVTVLSDSSQTDIKAKAVIVATGGFLGNSRLMAKYDSLYSKNDVLYRGIKHRGDGFLMALAAGASTDGQLTIEMESPTFVASQFLSVVCKQPDTIWVNKVGERFTDEDAATNEEASNAIYRQPGKTCFVIFDEAILQQMMADELSPMAQRATGGKPFKEEVVKAISRCKKEGSIKVSNSLNAMAKWMGADPDKLTRTIDAYNAFCDRGHDAEFVKNRRYLHAITKPPFYAIPCKVSLLLAHCGISVNDKTEALDQHGRAVPGLYVVGADMAGTAANTYNIKIAGNSFGFAIGSGRIAGEEVANYIGH